MILGALSRSLPLLRDSARKAFAPNVNERNISITTSGDNADSTIERLFPSIPPILPGSVDIGPVGIKTLSLTGNPTDDINIPAGALAAYTGGIGAYEVEAVIRALSRKSGNDLLSAPKITVLSKKTAQIVIAKR